jgi:hypothetical protein
MDAKESEQVKKVLKMMMKALNISMKTLKCTVRPMGSSAGSNSTGIKMRSAFQAE